MALGLDYHGVDASARMVEVARRALGERVVQGTFDYEPDAAVDVTTIFRSLYLVPDRRAFMERLRAFTRVKLVFDFDPRAYPADAMHRDLRLAGWERIAVRPFLMPQRASAAAAPSGRAVRARAAARRASRDVVPVSASGQRVGVNEPLITAPRSRESLMP